MSCDVAAISMSLWLAAARSDPHVLAERLLVSAVATVPTNGLAREPLYASIVSRAKALKAEVDRYSATGAAPDLKSFRSKVEALAALDMKGHLDLAARGADGDLKCILKGIAQDLPKRMDEMAAATTGPARIKALSEMAYLLNDNVEVITAPPKPPV
jgi:hypothetical protein